ncbi:hypothetical protein ACIPC2_14295 [Curtobacterium pusillum]|uniref:hypothetical protein n=1 Tax=Curtobacterium pusillum TaxID=69373 RepID=UPI0038149249
MTEIEINKKAGLLLCDLMESNAEDRSSVVWDATQDLTAGTRARVLLNTLLQFADAWDAAVSTPENRARLAVNIAQARAVLS